MVMVHCHMCCHVYCPAVLHHSLYYCVYCQLKCLLTWSTTPASAGLRARDASRLLKRWAPVVSSGSATCMPQHSTAQHNTAQHGSELIMCLFGCMPRIGCMPRKRPRLSPDHVQDPRKPSRPVRHVLSGAGSLDAPHRTADPSHPAVTNPTPVLCFDRKGNARSIGNSFQSGRPTVLPTRMSSPLTRVPGGMRPSSSSLSYTP
jgi:hypothetical protein